MEKLLAVIISIVVLFSVYVFSLVFTEVKTEKACLDLGYHSAKVAWDYSCYCSRIVDQTQYVIPLDEAKRQ